MPCEIGPYNRILDFGKTHFILERVDITKANELNFNNKICAIEKTLNIWKCRKLTLMGKINIVKTLALAKLIYSTSVLNFPKHFIT